MELHCKIPSLTIGLFNEGAVNKSIIKVLITN